MNELSYEEFINTNEYQSFINNNPDTGTLKVFAYTAYKAMPLEGVNVTITKNIGNNKVTFFSGFTDSSGIIDDIILPTPKEEKIASYDLLPQATSYDLTASLKGYGTVAYKDIPMYGGTKMIQYIKMIGDVVLKGDDYLGN